MASEQARYAKLHLIIDENRVPLNYYFTGGNVNDNKIAKILVDKLHFNRSNKRKWLTIVGDKGYLNSKLYEHYKKSKINYLAVIKKNTVRR